MSISPEKTFAITTLGCRINFYESEWIREAFAARGYTERSFESGADVMLIHSCAVTAQSERKSRSYLSRALRRKAKTGGVVALFGCMGQKREGELYDLYPELDVVWGNADLPGLVRFCDERSVDKDGYSIPKIYDTPSIDRWYSPRAFVKIQDGCNQFCTYCIVPYLRGRERSRPLDEIVSEVGALCAHGAREIVLTGIETASFGAERLCELSERIAENERVSRIRFGSLKPTIFTKEFSRRILQNPKVMPQFHLSVQSASENVLRAMRRPYGEKELSECVEHLYAVRGDLALTADLICGFPGETQEDFLVTRRFVEDAKLLHAHIFPYSKREGTVAAKLPGQIPEPEKRRRAGDLDEAAKRVGKKRFDTLLPLEHAILVEKIENGVAHGHTEHFLPLALDSDPGDAVGALKNFDPNEVVR